MIFSSLLMLFSATYLRCYRARLASENMDESLDGARLELEKQKAQQDYELRKQELDLKRRELDLREADQRASAWRSPLFVGVLVAALGLFGNIGVTVLQNGINQTLAKQKAQSDLILEAVKTGDTSKANANLLFFIDAHLIDDSNDSIKKAIRNGTGPTLPAPVAEQLGEAYWMGTGGRQRDYNEALKAFRMAAEQGDARAMANIGWIYENGFGVQRDHAEAMKWYKSAADRGDLIANWNIGRLYEFGSGVSTDLDMAKLWYQKCADRGDARCAKYLKDVGHNPPY